MNKNKSIVKTAALCLTAAILACNPKPKGDTDVNSIGIQDTTIVNIDSAEQVRIPTTKEIGAILTTFHDVTAEQLAAAGMTKIGYYTEEDSVEEHEPFTTVYSYGRNATCKKVWKGYVDFVYTAIQPHAYVLEIATETSSGACLMFKKKEDAEAFMEQVSQVTPKPNQNGILETDGCIYEKEIKLVDGWYKILIPLDY